MIQGIQNNNEIYSAINSISSSSIKQASPSAEEENTTENKAAKTDSVEISQEGKAANAAATALAGSSSTESTSTTETEPVLSNLTEAELDDLVDDGTITQAEKNSEMARRESLENAEKSNESEDFESKINLLDDDTF